MDRQVLLDGLAFAEGPRWRHGRLYFSDVPTGEVLSVDLDGKRQVVASIEGLPSGLGWLPDGTLLIARMEPPAVLAVSPDGAQRVHADLTGLASFPLNDMVVDADGRAWVGSCDGAGIPAPSASELVFVAPDGTASVADSAMRFPNGSVVTPDGRTLIVAETFGQGLVAFDIAEDGTVANKRPWAEVPGSLPDGICLDVEGAVWFADALAQSFVRVAEGGEVLQRIEVGYGAFACTLGGEDMRTLFLLLGRFPPGAASLVDRPGRIEMVTVDVPGTGSP
jgi:sugar lactone lactonase YvrE